MNSSKPHSDSPTEPWETIYQHIFDSAPDSIIVHRWQGNILKVNEKACEELGYAASELRKMKPQDLEAGLDPAIHTQRREYLDQHGEMIYETLYQRADGNTFPAEVSSRLLQRNESKLVISNVRDISERKDKEKLFHRLNGFLNVIRSVNALVVQDRPPDALLDKTCQRLIDTGRCTRAVICITDESIGREVYCAAAESDGEDICKAINYDNLTPCARRVIDTPGTVVPFDHYDICGDCPLGREKLCTRTGIACTLKSGKHVFGCLLAFMHPDRDNNPTELGFLQEIAEDVGICLGQIAADRERKAAQRRLERSQQELRELNKELKRSNQQLQDFTRTASHDLQEPLRKIHTFSEFLEEDFQEHIPEEGLKHIHRIKDASQRMKRLIEHLLELSRVGTQGKDFNEFSLGNVIDNSLDTVRTKLEDLDADVTLPSRTPTVQGDSLQIEEVITNLLTNAIKYRSPDEPLRIRITVEEEDNGGEVKVGVEDNGIGIDDKYQSKIFRPFTRLHRKDEYHGTGVGLALCKKIIERHEGEIWVESEPGEGSTFYFTLGTTVD